MIGSADRLKCGVVGDPVNLAARVENLTKQLGTMLVTEQTRDGLEDPSRYAMRRVARVRVKGLSAPTTLYEVLDGLPGAERDRKLATASRLGEAMAALASSDLVGAGMILDALALLDPDDPAVRWHRARVDELSRDGVPGDWDGTVQVLVK